MNCTADLRLSSQIIPHAVDYFTGKALEYDAEDFEDDDDDEDMDSDDFDDDVCMSTIHIPPRRTQFSFVADTVIFQGF